MFTVYIIHSQSAEKFYVGSTCNLDDRLIRHNQGRSKFTKSGTPWVLVHTEEFATRPEAARREREIKSWKSARAIRHLLEEHQSY